MTLSNFCFNLLLRLKRLDSTIEVSRPTLKVIINEALQYAYKFALRTDYTFYVRSQTFASTTTVNYSTGTGFVDLIYVEITGATDGQARISSNRQYQTLLNNAYENPGASSPIIRMGPTSFTLSTAAAGTFYYIWSFGYQDTDATEISTLIPWIYDEVILLKSMEITRVRHNLIPIIEPSELQKQLKDSEDAVRALKDNWKWLPTYKREEPGPV